jgi:hypothetical protein
MEVTVHCSPISSSDSQICRPVEMNEGPESGSAEVDRVMFEDKAFKAHDQSAYKRRRLTEVRQAISGHNAPQYVFSSERARGTLC